MTATKVDKTPVGDSEQVGEGFYPDFSRSLESLRHIRLMALLRDMIEAEDGAKAAARLGVSYRTVSRAIESGRLTARMDAALERHLLLGGGSAAAQQRREIEALTKRVASLEEELRGVRETVEGRNEGLEEERARALRKFERRLARLESGGGAQEGPEHARRRVAPSRPYPQLVTEEAEPDEEPVYGDAAPVIAEWRVARARSREAIRSGTTVEKLATYERVLELEIELIGERELTLPPAIFPWDRSDRRENLSRRREALEGTRTDRARAERLQRLLRLLTFGRWRK